MIFTTIFLSIIGIIDLAFILICFLATREGMEAMGILFILWPLAGLHVLFGGVKCINQFLNRKTIFPLYFIIVSALMGGSYYLYVDIKPKGPSVYRILMHKTYTQQKQLVKLKDENVFAVRQTIERVQDSNHADLCQALTYPRDLDNLQQILKAQPDLTSKCALLDGGSAMPIFAVFGNGYRMWEKTPAAKRTQLIDDIRATVKLLLENGANPNQQDSIGNTPLHWALRYNDEQLATLLIDNKA